MLEAVKKDLSNYAGSEPFPADISIISLRRKN
jgi:hypothetical protein